RGGERGDRWVRAGAGNGKTDEPKRVIEKARKRRPRARARRTVANCLEVLRSYDDALKEYAAALREQPGEPLLMRRYVRLLLSVGRTRDAVDLLDSIIKNPLTMSKDDVAWARRNLAVLGAAERNPEQFDRAFALLKQNETELGPNIEDMRARVILMTQQPAKTGAEVSPRRQAIELLEIIVQHAQAGREDRFVLAKLCDTDGN